MPSVLGVDPSLTRTGLGFTSDHRNAPKLIHCSSFSMKASMAPVDDWIAGMWEILQTMKPDIVIMEAALDIIPDYANAGQLRLNRIDGGLRGLCVAGNIQHHVVLPSKWRQWALGNGKLDRDEAKRMARRHCGLLGIEVDNIDQAEAALICFYGTGLIKGQDLSTRSSS